MPRTFEGWHNAARVTKSLFTSRIVGENLDVAKENARSSACFPFNSELALLPDFLKVAAEKDGYLTAVSRWVNDRQYDPIEVLTTSIEFFDRHGAALPQTTLPPEAVVARFANVVLDSNKRLNLAEQFALLLTITEGDIIAAANLGMLATRLLARGWDTRAYPNIGIGPNEIRKANRCFAQTESTLESVGDALGDTYYFWTHFFAAIAYRQLGDANSRILNGVFGIGTPVMSFVRAKIAGQPTLASHFEASEMGRHVGLAIGDYFRAN